MKYWINVGFSPVEYLVPIARHAEALGFDGLSLADHLFFPEQASSRYPYSATGDTVWPEGTPWPDAWVAIAAMAAVTERIEFNTGVYVAPLRDPFTLAKATGTTAVLAQGRLSCGFGTGWLREEFDVVGIEFESRGKRFDEMLDVLQLLWSGEMVEYSGQFYNFPPIQMCPAAPRIPILIGGNTGVGMRRATRYDGWIGAHMTVSQTDEVVKKMRKIREDSELRDRPFSISVTGPRAARDAAALAEVGVDALIVPLAALRGGPTLDDRLEALDRFAESIR